MLSDEASAVLLGSGIILGWGGVCYMMVQRHANSL